MKNEKVNVSVQITKEMNDILIEISKKEDIEKSKLIRKAIQYYLNK